MKEKMKKHSRARTFIQAVSAVLFNGYLIGYLNGKIFGGSSKAVCLPVLNCYSCPGALGSCPIGSLQAVMGSRKFDFSFYVLGTVMLFGVVLGRVICGFLCPFGFFQDLLHRIPTKKFKIPKKVDKPMRYIKYIILALTFILPIIWVNSYGVASPYFCKWICPAGTLGAGIPLILTNPPLQQAIGFLFNWKMGVLITIIILCVFNSRFFCKYLCPLGAFYGFFNRFSIYQMEFDKGKCVDCGRCDKACPMSLEVTKEINHAECIKCGDCKASCPTGAIDKSFCKIKQSPSKTTEGEV